LAITHTCQLALPKQWLTHLSKLQLLGDLNCYHSTPPQLESVRVPNAQKVRVSLLAGGCVGNLSAAAVTRVQGKQILSQMRPPLCFCNLIRAHPSAARQPRRFGFSHISLTNCAREKRDFKRASSHDISGGAALELYTCGSRH
jgi:hypothetical protein